MSAALEKHYTVLEVATMWSMSENKVRQPFRDAPGVLQTQVRTIRARKRQNLSLRIPESVLLCRHAEMSVRIAA